MKAISSRCDSFISSMFGDLAPTGRVWARVGLVVLAVAAWMSFDFGHSVSFKHACFLAALTFVAAFGPEAAYKAWQQGKFGSAIAIAAVCAPLLAIEFYSHAGYTAGLRGHNLAEARVANVRYDGAQDAVKEDKANLALWTKRLADLEAENAWVATVTAEALRAKLAGANLAIEQEAKRVKCGQKCLALTKERDELSSKIALAEEKGELQKKIEATKRVLDKARAKADTTEHKSSAVAHQNAFLAKAVALVGFGSLQPTETIEVSAEQSANLAMAIAGTGLPAFCLFVAGLYRREEPGDGFVRSAQMDLSPQRGDPTPPAMAAHPRTTVDLDVFEVKDGAAADLRNAIHQAIRNVRGGTPLVARGV